MGNQNKFLAWIAVGLSLLIITSIFMSINLDTQGLVDQRNIFLFLFLIPIAVSVFFLGGLETLLVSIAVLILPTYAILMPQYSLTPYSTWSAEKGLYEYLLYLSKPMFAGGVIWQIVAMFLLSFWTGFYLVFLKGRINNLRESLSELQKSCVKLENEKTQFLYKQERYGKDINSLGSLLITLSELAKEIPSVLEINSLFRLVMDKTVELLGATACAIFYIDDVSGRLIYACSVGYDEKKLLGLNLSASEESGMVGWCAKYGKFLSTLEAEQDPHMTDVLRQSKFPVFLCQPIVERGKSIAVIAVGEMQKQFKESELMRLTSLLASLSSISIENARLMKKTKEQAIRDGLTGLYNHRHFYEQLEEYMKKVGKQDMSLGVCLIDIDFFKNFNDTYGHLVGDLILQEVAKIIQNQIQKDDFAARYGGEEFAIICMRRDSASMHMLAESLRKAVEQTVFKSGDLRLNVTISIGVAFYSIKNKDVLTSSGLVKCSDDALYKAKETGRNKVCIYG